MRRTYVRRTRGARPGATKPGVYFVDEPGSQEGARPVIKLLHLRGPAKKHDWYDWAWDNKKRKPINPTVLTRSELDIATWIERLLEDCPVFSQAVTTPRVMPLKTTVPGLGWKLDVPRAVTNTFAPGVSLDNIVFNMAPHDMANLLDALNSTRVQIAAVFDLLVAQGDRHGACTPDPTPNPPSLPRDCSWRGLSRFKTAWCLGAA